MVKLSVVISVRNGEKYISNCLQSVKNFADEIIVVDHMSTDNTIVFAKKFTKKIFQEKNDSKHIDAQKNFGFLKATNDWILSLDADEEVTEGLAKEFQKVLSQKIIYDAYFIPRKNIIFGKWIEHTGWYTDEQLRFFRKGKASYISEHVHEHISVNGTIGRLQNPLLHHNYDSMQQFFQRALFVYVPNEAEHMMKSGYSFSYKDSIRFPFQEFLRRYFAGGGYKDGFHGRMLSLLMAFYHFAIFAYLWEKNEFTDKNYSRKIFENEVAKSKNEFDHWITKRKIEGENNPVSKFYLRLKRKLTL